MADPSLLAVREDLESAAFQDGVVHGRWRVVRFEWPFLVVAIRAGGGGELGMRVELSGYPTAAPAGMPWDLEQDIALAADRLPEGPAAAVVFRSGWSQANGHTPYMASERLTVQGDHLPWAAQHPTRAWNPSRTLEFYVAELHKELRSCTMPKASA